MGLDISLTKVVVEREPIHEAYVTHNLTRMAEACDLYQCLWRPEELDITRACQLIEPLQRGLDRLRCNPEQFKAFDPPNGWGSYEYLVDFVEKLLEACRLHPEAEVEVSR